MIKIGKKKFTKNDMYTIQKKFSEIEKILEWTDFSEEGVLVNKISSYLKFKIESKIKD